MANLNPLVEVLTNQKLPEPKQSREVIIKGFFVHKDFI